MLQNKHKRLTNSFLDRSAINRYYSTSPQTSPSTQRDICVPKLNKFWQSQKITNNPKNTPQQLYVCYECQICSNHIPLQAYKKEQTSTREEYFEDTFEHLNSKHLYLSVQNEDRKDKEHYNKYQIKMNILTDEIIKKQQIINKIKEENKELVNKNQQLIKKLFQKDNLSKINPIHKTQSRQNNVLQDQTLINQFQNQISQLKIKQGNMQRQIQVLNFQIAQLTQKQKRVPPSNQNSKNVNQTQKNNLISELQIQLQKQINKHNKLQIENNQILSQYLALKHSYLSLKQGLEHSMTKNNRLQQHITELEVKIQQIGQWLYKLEAKSSQQLYQFNKLIAKFEEREMMRQRQIVEIRNINQMQDSLCENINENVRRQNQIFAMLGLCEARIREAYGKIDKVGQLQIKVSQVVQEFENKCKQMSHKSFQ